jgi:hypothetical protein
MIHKDFVSKGYTVKSEFYIPILERSFERILSHTAVSRERQLVPFA